MVEDSSASFSFGRDEAFGIVEMVDTATVVVSVDDPAALARIQVNRLVAILGTRVGELYIGMVSKIVRKANLDDLWTAGDGASFASDTVKVLLVGTVREKDGTKKNVFKRSIASVPTVGAEVFLIEKDRLSILMGAISGDVGDGIKRLNIGRYAIDEETPAIIDGDKFFKGMLQSSEARDRASHGVSRRLSSRLQALIPVTQSCLTCMVNTRL